MKGVTEDECYCLVDGYDSPLVVRGDVAKDFLEVVQHLDSMRK